MYPAVGLVLKLLQISHSIESWFKHRPETNVNNSLEIGSDSFQPYVGGQRELLSNEMFSQFSESLCRFDHLHNFCPQCLECLSCVYRALMPTNLMSGIF